MQDRRMPTHLTKVKHTNSIHWATSRSIAGDGTIEHVTWHMSCIKARAAAANVREHVDVDAAGGRDKKGASGWVVGHPKQGRKSKGGTAGDWDDFRVRDT